MFVIGAFDGPLEDAEQQIRAKHRDQRRRRPEPQGRHTAQGQGHPGDHQWQPGAAAGDDPAGDRREHHDRQPERDQAQPGRQGVEAADLLQVERRHEQERTERAERQHRHQDRRGERDAAEQAEFEQRIGLSRLVPQKATKTEKQSTSNETITGDVHPRWADSMIA